MNKAHPDLANLTPSSTNNRGSLFDDACMVFLEQDASKKAEATLKMASGWFAGKYASTADEINRRAMREDNSELNALEDWPAKPARPIQPELLAPRDMPRRKMSGPNGRLAQLHALAHIELNAINLAVDIIGRFTFARSNKAFIDDWLKVAADEAKHFLMLRNRLRELDSDYGNLPAHDGLWDAAEDTKDDLLARLAIVPLVLEARGLDLTPMITAKFDQANDNKSARLLDVIYEDEKSHVGIGMKWFLKGCEDTHLDPEKTFKSLVAERFKAGLKPPFNEMARNEAGMPKAFFALDPI
jgi:uncharacterized ferritin-like protein (DUF455 family)